MIREGQTYRWKHFTEDNLGWGYNEPREVIEVIKVLSIDNDRVTYRFGSHAGNLTSPEMTESMNGFEASVRSKEYELIKDVPLIYVAPINRLDWVD